MDRQFFAILATSRRTALLENTLHSLAHCEKPDHFSGTIVIENGSGQTARSLVESFGPTLRTQYIYLPAGNKSRALNTAMERLADEALVFFTDDDVEFHPGILVEYDTAAREKGPGHMFGGPTDPGYDAQPPAWLHPFLPRSARGWFIDTPQITRLTKPKLLGFNWAAFVGDLRRIGGFDPNYGPGGGYGSGQETYAQIKLLRRGVQCWYLPEARVRHYVPVERCTPEWALRRAYRMGRGYGLFQQTSLRRTFWYLAATGGLTAARIWKRMPTESIEERPRFAAEYYESLWGGVLEGLKAHHSQRLSVAG